MVEIKEIILHCSVTHSTSSNCSPFIVFFVFDLSVDPIKPSHLHFYYKKMDHTSSFLS